MVRCDVVNSFPVCQTVERCDPHVGLLHRGTEKLMEYKTYMQVQRASGFSCFFSQLHRNWCSVNVLCFLSN